MIFFSKLSGHTIIYAQILETLQWCYHGHFADSRFYMSWSLKGLKFQEILIVIVRVKKLKIKLNIHQEDARMI